MFACLHICCDGIVCGNGTRTNKPRVNCCCDKSFHLISAIIAIAIFVASIVVAAGHTFIPIDYVIKNYEICTRYYANQTIISYNNYYICKINFIDGSSCSSDIDLLCDGCDINSSNMNDLLTKPRHLCKKECMMFAVYMMIQKTGSTLLFW